MSASRPKPCSAASTTGVRSAAGKWLTRAQIVLPIGPTVRSSTCSPSGAALWFRSCGDADAPEAGGAAAGSGGKGTTEGAAAGRSDSRCSTASTAASGTKACSSNWRQRRRSAWEASSSSGVQIRSAIGPIASRSKGSRRSPTGTEEEGGLGAGGGRGRRRHSGRDGGNRSLLQALQVFMHIRARQAGCHETLLQARQLLGRDQAWLALQQEFDHRSIRGDQLGMQGRFTHRRAPAQTRRGTRRPRQPLGLIQQAQGIGSLRQPAGGQLLEQGLQPAHHLRLQPLQGPSRLGLVVQGGRVLPGVERQRRNPEGVEIRGGGETTETGPLGGGEEGPARLREHQPRTRCRMADLEARLYQRKVH